MNVLVTEYYVNKVRIARGMVRDKPKSPKWASFLKELMPFFLSKYDENFLPGQSWTQYVLESQDTALLEAVYGILRCKTKTDSLWTTYYSLVNFGSPLSLHKCEGLTTYPHLYKKGYKTVHCSAPKFEGRCLICDVKCEKCAVRKRVPFTGRCGPCLNVTKRNRFICGEAVICLILCLNRILVERVGKREIPAKNLITLIAQKVWDERHEGDEWRTLYERTFWIPYGWRRNEDGQIVEVDQHKTVIHLVRNLRDKDKISWAEISYNLCKAGIMKYHLGDGIIEKIYNTKL